MGDGCCRGRHEREGGSEMEGGPLFRLLRSHLLGRAGVARRQTRPCSSTCTACVFRPDSISDDSACARCTSPARSCSSTIRGKSPSSATRKSGGSGRRALRRGARRQQLHVRRGHAHATHPDFAASTVRALEHLGAVPMIACLRSAQERCRDARPLRPRAHRRVRGARATLRHGRYPRASLFAARQGEG